MANPFSLEGKTILITGASSGIGRACAVVCASAGAKCILTARNKDRLKATLDSLAGEEHLMFLADLTKDDDRRALISALEKVDGVILNAGINDKSLVKFLKEDFICKMLNTNFTAAAMLAQGLLKGKKLNAGGSIVFMSSISAFFPSITNAMYGATKAAINQFARVLSLEVMPQRIRVNSIEPAFVETEMLHAYALQDNINAIREQNFNGRFTTPEEVAYACQYLLSDAAQMITGTTMVIDGGYTIKK